MQRYISISTTGALLLVGALAGCSSSSRGDNARAPSQEPSPVSEAEPASPPGELRAEAKLVTAEGTEEGKATFVQEPDGVRVVIELADVPQGKKGVHVHEKGDCSNIAGESMGSHFAPQSDQHALPSEGAQRHLGDLGNIVVSADGNGRLEIKVPDASLDPSAPTTFMGRALVVHSGEDTGSAQQPSGGSGPPMACGVIRKG